MEFKVEFSPASDRELRSLPVFDQRKVTDGVRAHLLTTPVVVTRRRKCLGSEVTADFEFAPPLWELRIGDIRVFYEVDELKGIVYIHAVRHKPPGRTTDEVLHETNPR